MSLINCDVEELILLERVCQNIVIRRCITDELLSSFSVLQLLELIVVNALNVEFLSLVKLLEEPPQLEAASDSLPIRP